MGYSRPSQEPQIAVHGLRRRGGDRRVTVEDTWHIGSVGKSVTATLLARIFGDRFPKLDCRLPELLPDIDMHEGWQACTLYHLLTSSAGLPGNFPLRVFLEKEENPQALLALRKKYIAQALTKQPKHPSGSAFAYSNLGYTIAGYIAEVETQKTYPELVREHVFEPLGLTNSGYGTPRGDFEGDQPMGHQVMFGWRRAMSPYRSAADLTAVIAPAGRIRMSLAGLLKFGRVHMEGTHHLLQSDSWVLLHSPCQNSYACGWVIEEQHRLGTPVWWHNGSNKMWYTLLLLLPEHNCVMAFVTNDGAIRKADLTFYKAAQELLEKL